MTSANVHDSRLAEALIQGEEQGYFATRPIAPLVEEDGRQEP